jgi:hypothetical protein
MGIGSVVFFLLLWAGGVCLVRLVVGGTGGSAGWMWHGMGGGDGGRGKGKGDLVAVWRLLGAVEGFFLGGTCLT